MASITHKTSVSSVALAPAVDAWRRLGCPEKVIEQALSTHYQHLSSRWHWIPVTTVADAYRAVARELQDPLLGLRTGNEMDLTRLGAVSNLLLYAPTVGSAIKTMATFNALLSHAMQFELKEEGDLALLCMDYNPALKISYHQIDNFISAILKLFYTVIPHYSVSVKLTHKPEVSSADYQQLTFSEFKFGQPRNQLCFPAQYLNTRVPWSDIRVFETSKKIAQEDFERIKNQANLPDIVKELIKSRLQHGEPDQANIAKALNLSIRNLQIKLKEYDVRFRDLVNDCRKETALTLVEQQKHSSREISNLLGYSDTMTYYRAFKRWTGYSVMDYINRLES